MIVCFYWLRGVFARITRGNYLGFFGGVQLLAVSILGEYLSKIFEEAKARPKFIRKSVIFRGKKLNSAAEIENFKRDSQGKG